MKKHTKKIVTDTDQSLHGTVNSCDKWGEKSVTRKADNEKG